MNSLIMKFREKGNIKVGEHHSNRSRYSIGQGTLLEQSITVIEWSQLKTVSIHSSYLINRISTSKHSDFEKLSEGPQDNH